MPRAPATWVKGEIVLVQAPNAASLPNGTHAKVIRADESGVLVRLQSGVEVVIDEGDIVLHTGMPTRAASALAKTSEPS